jgi:hypothetical protein
LAAAADVEFEVRRMADGVHEVTWLPGGGSAGPPAQLLVGRVDHATGSWLEKVDVVLAEVGTPEALRECVEEDWLARLPTCVVAVVRLGDDQYGVRVRSASGTTVRLPAELPDVGLRCAVAAGYLQLSSQSQTVLTENLVSQVRLSPRPRSFRCATALPVLQIRDSGA